MKNKVLSVISCIILLSIITGCENKDFSRQNKEIKENKVDYTETNDSQNVNDNSNKVNNNNIKEEQIEFDANTLNEEIKKQPLYVYSTKYEVQDSNLKCLYPDIMISNIKNNSDGNIKSAIVAFTAWDKNNFPVKIDSGTTKNYLALVKYDDINLTPGATFNNTGLSLSCVENSAIKSFKSIVVSYEDFDGNEWQNPLYNNWKKLYENKVLQ